MTFLLLKTRLLYTAKKPSFECKQGLFWEQTSLVFKAIYKRLRIKEIQMHFPTQKK